MCRKHHLSDNRQAKGFERLSDPFGRPEEELVTSRLLHAADAGNVAPGSFASGPSLSFPSRLNSGKMIQQFRWKTKAKT